MSYITLDFPCFWGWFKLIHTYRIVVVQPRSLGATGQRPLVHIYVDPSAAGRTNGFPPLPGAEGF